LTLDQRFRDVMLVRMRLIMFAAALAGCGAETSAPTTTASSRTVASAGDAIDRFITAWNVEVRPTVPTHKDPLIARIDGTMREPKARERYAAERRPCRDATRAMKQLVADTHYDFVLHGAIAVADRHAHCWAVTYTCCMKGDVGGVLDADTGELLAVWRIPEG
jgi:hypothetical protein